MSIEILRALLGWATLINFGILTLWFLLICFARDWIYRLHSQWFKLSPEHFALIHYSGMALYKIGVILFNVVPYLALWIVA